MGELKGVQGHKGPIKTSDNQNFRTHINGILWEIERGYQGNKRKCSPKTMFNIM
jgi:hypothetical protein